LELLRLDFEEKKNEAYLKRLAKIAARPLKTGNVPPNFSNATALNDDTTRPLIEEWLSRVIAVEDAQGFVGASARILLANQWLGQENRATDGEVAKRIETMAAEVIRLSTDPNLLMQAFDARGRLARLGRDLDRAFAVYDEMAARVADPRMKSMALFFKGETLLDKGEAKNAMDTLAKAQDTCADRNDCCRIADRRARKYMELQDKPRAREVYALIRDKLPDCWARGEALQMLEQLK
jgi:tetratricopeptide (TPR) repeat protein